MHTTPKKLTKKRKWHNALKRLMILVIRHYRKHKLVIEFLIIVLRVLPKLF